jgi:hypothetical protein
MSPRKGPKPWPYKNLVGKIIGKLTVVSIAPRKKAWTMYYCDCACGREGIVAYSTHLIRGIVQSCGCDRPKGENHAQWTGFGEISGGNWNKISRSNRSGNRRAREGITFELDIQYGWNLFLEQGRRCALTGQILIFSNKSSENTASLDRIDSTKSYVVGNVQWVHKDVNKMKNVYSQDYFINTCTLVAGLHSVKI